MSVRAIAGADAQPLTDALYALGSQLIESDDLVVVVTDDYQDVALKLFDAKARSASMPWIPVKISGTMLWLGPALQADGACWECLQQRLRLNQPVRQFLEQHKQTITEWDRSTARPFLDLHAHLAASELVRFNKTCDRPRLGDHLLTFDPVTFDARLHSVARRPQCLICGDESRFAPTRVPVPIVLEDAPKMRTSATHHRTASPEQIAERYQQLISPITGVISELVKWPATNRALGFNHSARHGFPLLHDDVFELRKNLRGRSGGKGTCEAESIACAIGEALERYSGVFHAEEEIRVHANFHDLGGRAIDPNECLRFSKRQYETREDWNRAQNSRNNLVPNPFSREAVIDWTPVWSMSNQTFRFLPTSLCYYGHPDIVKWGFCGADSNGCATGSTLAEAFAYGFLELVERDSVALWWYNRVQRPLVDPEGSGIEDYYGALVSYYRELGRALWVIDITSDTGIPAFAAISARSDHFQQDITIGYGAHLAPSEALLHALMELNQFLPMITDPAYKTENVDARRWFSECTTSNQPYLMPLDSAPVRTIGNYPNRASDNILQDASRCLEVAHILGLEVLCLDQTRPDIGIPTCRVIVPGFRHFWRRLGSGRLYDVPLKLGWLSEARDEAELNPIPMFF